VNAALLMMAAHPELPFAFVNAALDRAEHLRMNPAALRTLYPRARVLQIDADGLALGDVDGPVLHAFAAAAAADAAVFLGLDADGNPWFAHPAAASDTASRLDLRSAAAHWPALDSTAFAQARAVLHWRARQRFCGSCGGGLAFERAGWLGRCPACATEHYPRTDPAVIAVISDGERLLLGRNPGWAAGLYSNLAGFVEPGETLEQALAREVQEESGVRITGCRYLASQPWPFPSSLMLGFIAGAKPDVPRANDEELEDVRWFSREAIGAALNDASGESGLRLPPKLSISRWLIETWFAQSAPDPLRPNAQTLRAIEEAEAGRLTPTTIDGIMAEIDAAQE